MALLPNASVTYGDLITEAYNKIIALVQNRDAYSNAVPAEIKAGYKKTTTITLDHALKQTCYLYICYAYGSKTGCGFYATNKYRLE